MRAQLSATEFDLFRNYIEQNCGISLSSEKKYLIETRLAGLLVESGSQSFTEFYRKLDASPGSRLRAQMIDAMTTNETLWFRDGSPWIALRDHIIPELEAKATGRHRIWSAACSTGQEPYSIAMLIDHVSGMAGRRIMPSQVEIVATDISSSALMVAQRGIYDRISMNRGFTGEWGSFKTKYFNATGAISTISPSIKSRVKFRQFNLQGSLASLGRFDVVFLRNVAIYFSEEFKKDLLNRIANILNPGGLLLLGSAETTHGYSDRFKTASLGRAIAYRRAG